MDGRRRTIRKLESELQSAYDDERSKQRTLGEIQRSYGLTPARNDTLLQLIAEQPKKKWILITTIVEQDLEIQGKAPAEVDRILTEIGQAVKNPTELAALRDRVFTPWEAARFKKQVEARVQGTYGSFTPEQRELLQTLALEHQANYYALTTILPQNFELHGKDSAEVDRILTELKRTIADPQSFSALRTQTDTEYKALQNKKKVETWLGSNYAGLTADQKSRLAGLVAPNSDRYSGVWTIIKDWVEIHGTDSKAAEQLIQELGEGFKGPDPFYALQTRVQTALQEAKLRKQIVAYVDTNFQSGSREAKDQLSNLITEHAKDWNAIRSAPLSGVMFRFMVRLKAASARS